MMVQYLTIVVCTAHIKLKPRDTDQTQSILLHGEKKSNNEMLYCNYPKCIASSRNEKIIKPSNDSCKAFQAIVGTCILTICDTHYELFYYRKKTQFVNNAMICILHY